MSNNYSNDFEADFIIELHPNLKKWELSHSECPVVNGSTIPEEVENVETGDKAVGKPPWKSEKQLCPFVEHCNPAGFIYFTPF